MSMHRQGSSQSAAYAAETLAEPEGACKPAAGGFGLLLAGLPARPGLQRTVVAMLSVLKAGCVSMSGQNQPLKLAWGSTQTLRQMLASPPQDVQTCSRWVVRIELALLRGLLRNSVRPQGN